MVLEGIKYELRQTFYEFLTLKADWRRISRRVAPVAAFVTLGAGVLYARKRQNPPDSGRVAEAIRSPNHPSCNDERLSTWESLAGISMISMQVSMFALAFQSLHTTACWRFNTL